MLAPEPVFRNYAGILQNLALWLRWRSTGSDAPSDDLLKSITQIARSIIALLLEYEESNDLRVRAAGLESFFACELGLFIMRPVFQDPLDPPDSSTYYGRVAPEPIVRVFLEVFDAAMVYVVRSVESGHRLPAGELFSISDAIHNIPQWITNYRDDFDCSWMRDYLSYRHRWSYVHGQEFSLVKVFDEAVSRYPHAQLHSGPARLSIRKQMRTFIRRFIS